MTRNRDLRYSLSLDLDEFEAAQSLVKAVLLTSNRRQRPFDTLVQATEDYTALPDKDREYVETWDADKNGSLEGVCCWPGNDVPEFHIWLSPQMNPLQDLYRISLLHELVHGYMCYSSHDAKFRDVLGRVMYHYCDIVSPLDSPGFQTLALNYRYTKRKPGEEEGEYMRRIIAAKDKTQTKAETEYSSVVEMYERIS